MVVALLYCAVDEEGLGETNGIRVTPAPHTETMLAYLFFPFCWRATLSQWMIFGLRRSIYLQRAAAGIMKPERDMETLAK